jgi:hypothetical protein
MKVERMNNSNEIYTSPRVVEIVFDCEGILCQSGVIDDDKDGEGYGGENDFEW